MKLKHCITILLLIAAINFMPVLVHAQDFDNGDPDASSNTGVPFDGGGISILIAAGVAYGLKRKYDENKII